LNQGIKQGGTLIRFPLSHIVHGEINRIRM